MQIFLSPLLPHSLPLASKSAAKSRSLDDLLTLSSALPAPVPTLDLAPLKADIGEIMMAGEGSSSDNGSAHSSDNEEEGPANEPTHTLTQSQ